MVLTDIQVELPEGCYGRIAPRSGLAAKNFIDVGGRSGSLFPRPLLTHIPCSPFQLVSSMRTIAGTLALSCSITQRPNSRSPKEIALPSSSVKGSSIRPWKRSRHLARHSEEREDSVPRELIKSLIH